MYRSVSRDFAHFIGRTDCLTGSHSTSRHPSATDLGPVVSASFIIDFWCASEFTGHDNQHTFIQTTLVDVLNQRTDRLIVNRGAELQCVEDVMIHRVVVPVVHAATKRTGEVAGDDVDPGFAIVIATEGRGVLTTNGHGLEIARGDALLIPYSAGPWSLSGNVVAMVSRPPDPFAPDAPG